MISRDWMGKIARIPCIICRELGLGDTAAHVHHIGDRSERSDWLVIPLCPEHHQGATGFHGLGEREFNRRYKTNELILLGKTLEMVQKHEKYGQK